MKTPITELYMSGQVDYTCNDQIFIKRTHYKGVEILEMLKSNLIYLN